MRYFVLLLCIVHLGSLTGIAQPTGNANVVIGNHSAIYDSNGMLLPWTSWQDAIAREIQWYLQCPVTHGYPNFVWMTFMDGNYQPDPRRSDFIPATQNGMGIISYLKYYVYDERRNRKVLAWAKYMGDYLINESNTPDAGRYPRFTRSTGIPLSFPNRQIAARKVTDLLKLNPTKAPSPDMHLRCFTKKQVRRNISPRRCTMQKCLLQICSRVIHPDHRGRSVLITGPGKRAVRFRAIWFTSLDCSTFCPLWIIRNLTYRDGDSGHGY